MAGRRFPLFSGNNEEKQRLPRLSLGEMLVAPLTSQGNHVL
jgi:hypothetical protein